MARTVLQPRHSTLKSRFPVPGTDRTAALAGTLVALPADRDTRGQRTRAKLSCASRLPLMCQCRSCQSSLPEFSLRMRVRVCYVGRLLGRSRYRRWSFDGDYCACRLSSRLVGRRVSLDAEEIEQLHAEAAAKSLCNAEGCAAKDDAGRNDDQNERIAGRCVQEDDPCAGRCDGCCAFHRSRLSAVTSSSGHKWRNVCVPRTTEYRRI
jgi:hypothetical protein